ncbi:MAG: hypothetical protein ACREIP_10805 [Alphaproteobacteria bacterium]
MPTWQIALVLVIALSLAIAVAIVAAGVFLVALPIIAIAVLAFRLFGRRRARRGDSIIEGEYEVIDAARARHPYHRPRR